MAELPKLMGWKCNVAIDGMAFEGVEISEVLNAGIIINEKDIEKFLPWSVIRVITKTGEIEVTRTFGF